VRSRTTRGFISIGDTLGIKTFNQDFDLRRNREVRTGIKLMGITPTKRAHLMKTFINERNAER